MKKYTFPVTRKGWEENTEQYAKLWDSEFKQWLSEQERGFIKESFQRSFPQKTQAKLIPVLDIGFAAGRILSIYLDTFKLKNVYGIDYAQNMVDYIKQKYKGRVHVQKCDITKNIPSFKKKFYFVTAIRVLKYSSNWEKSIAHVSRILGKGGYFLFTLPNQNSLTYFASDSWPKVSINDIKEILHQNNMELIDADGFMRMPEFFYTVKSLSRVYIVGESVLHAIFRKHFLSREIFFLAKKK